MLYSNAPNGIEKNTRKGIKMSHPIENIMRSTMEQIKEMVDVNTIVGNPIITGKETVILPVSKVSLGFLSGGGEYCASSAPVKKSGSELDGEARMPFAGTSVAGMSITPIAFLSVADGKVKVLPAQFNTTIDRAIEIIPESICMVGKVIGDACCRTEGKDDLFDEEDLSD